MTTIHSIFASALTLGALGACALGLTLPVSEDSSTGGNAVLGRSAGRDTALHVSAARQALVRFEAGAFADGIAAADLSKARLVIFIGSVSAPGALTLHRIVQDWSEHGTSVPAFDAVPLATIPESSVVARKFVIVEVTETVRAWLRDPGSDFGFAIAARGGARVLLGAKEGSAVGHPAQLQIETRDAPPVAARMDGDDGSTGARARVRAPVTGLLTNADIPANSLKGNRLRDGTVPGAKLVPNLTLLGTTKGTFSGTFSGPFTGSGAGLTDLDASNLASGTVPDARLSANVVMRNAASLTGSGAGLTDLDASNLASGTVPDARLSANVVMRNGAALNGLNAVSLTQPAAKITAVSANGGYVKVASGADPVFTVTGDRAGTTPRAHGFDVGTPVTIAGLAGGAAGANGAWIVATVPTPSTFTLESPPPVDAGTGGTAVGASTTQLTALAHGFSAGQKIVMSGFNDIGANYTHTPLDSPPGNYQLDSFPYTVSSIGLTADAFRIAEGAMSVAESGLTHAFTSPRDNPQLTIDTKVDTYGSATGNLYLRAARNGMHDAGTGIVLETTDGAGMIHSPGLFSTGNMLQAGPRFVVVSGPLLGQGAGIADIQYESSTFSARADESNFSLVRHLPASVTTSFTIAGATADSLLVQHGTPSTPVVSITDYADHDATRSGTLLLKASGSSIGVSISLQGTQNGGASTHGWIKEGGNDHLYVGPAFTVLGGGTTGTGNPLADFTATTSRLYGNGTPGLTVAPGGDLQLQKTMTPAGTTANGLTINKTSGSVRLAPGDTSKVLNNALVSPSSIVQATVCTHDATCKSVQAVKSAGTITFYPNAAPTEEVEIDFIVTN